MKCIPDVKFLSDLENLVDRFIKRTRKLQKYNTYFAQKKAECHPESYYSEFCSLRIGLPRRGGNTTLAINLLRKYPKSIYIGLSKDITEEGLRRFDDLYPKKSCLKKLNALRFFTLRSCATKGIPFQPGVIVITDCLQFSSQSTMDKFYQNLDYCNPVFIHLG